MAVWVVRADGGVGGGNAVLRRNTFGYPFGFEQSLADFDSRDALRKQLRQLPRYGDVSADRVAAAASQMWSFAYGIQNGDTLLIPHRGHKVSAGVVEGDYIFLPNRGWHCRQMAWLVRNLPRYLLAPDLLFAICRVASVFEIRAEGLAERIEQLATAGQSVASVPDIPAEPIHIDHSIPPDWEQYTRDGIARRVRLKFSGHRLTDLVSGLLRAAGYNALETEFESRHDVPFSKITAGKGQWGFARPELTAYIKLGGEGQPTDWGGAFGPEGHTLRVSLDERDGDLSAFATAQRWGPNELAELVLRLYDNLPGDIRRDIPLRTRRVPVEADRRL